MADQQVEIFYALHGGEPIKIGGGTFDDVDRLGKEAAELDASTDLEDSNTTSPGTEHFYRSLGEIAEVAPVTSAALEHYSRLVSSAREAVRQRLGDTGSLL